MNDCYRLYGDIIHLSRPGSAYPRMARADRAKIFSPFAALKGYDEAVKEMEKPRVSPIQRLDEEKEQLNRVLCRLKRGERVAVTFFRSNPGPDGSGGTAEGVYETVFGTVRGVDAPFQKLRLEGREIAFDDILEIREEAS